VLPITEHDDGTRDKYTGHQNAMRLRARRAKMSKSVLWSCLLILPLAAATPVEAKKLPGKTKPATLVLKRGKPAHEATHVVQQPPQPTMPAQGLLESGQGFATLGPSSVGALPSTGAAAMPAGRTSIR
jgi:hypothetical protein